MEQKIDKRIEEWKKDIDDTVLKKNKFELAQIKTCIATYITALYDVYNNYDEISDTNLFNLCIDLFDFYYSIENIYI